MKVMKKNCIEKLEVLLPNYWLRFGIGSASVRPLRSWFGIGSAEPTKWRFGRSLSKMIRMTKNDQSGEND